MDKDEDEEEEIASEGSLEYDPYQVKNLMHDILVQEGEGPEAPTPRLAVLAEVVTLVEPSKRPYFLQIKFFYFTFAKNIWLKIKFNDYRRD